MPELLIGELVRQRMSALSASERRLARVLLASYPVAGLESLPRFAERAEVSPATVTRFIAKLGVHGYPEFQEALRQELQARLSSPMARFDRERSGPSGDSVLSEAFEAFEHSLHATLGTVANHDFEAVADLLSDTARRVLVLGGRVSAPFARYLSAQLHLLRPGVQLVEAERSTPADQLVDLGRRDVLVTFDYRRYQTDTIQGARLASSRGCAVVLITDPWLSPAAASARYVLVTSVATAAAFDSMVGAVALVEALVAAVLARLGDAAQLRMQQLDQFREGEVWGETVAERGRG